VATDELPAPQCRTPRWLSGLVVAWVILPMAGLMLWLGLRTVGNDQDRLNCVASGGALRIQEGTLRRAGLHWYVVDERWTLVTQGCNGKYRLQCLRENPGVEALEQHLSERIEVEFCGPHVVGYTVAGRSFRHGQPLSH